jgi:hypothetical protein
MIQIICRLHVFLFLSALCLVMGMREWNPAISSSVLLIIAALWAINWLLHHISPRWARYLRYGLLAISLALIILVPQLRETFFGIVSVVFGALDSLTSARLIALAIVFLVTHAVLCWSRPVVRVNA